MHFSVFAKIMRKWADFHEIWFRENISFSRKSRLIFAKIFAKTKNSDFRENIVKFSQKFLRKRKTPIFAKIFAKMMWNFRENFQGNEKRRKCSKILVTFPRKQKHRFLRKWVLFSKKNLFEILKMQCCGAGAGAASFGQSRSRNAIRL
jgi:hypothetical protein